MITSSERLLDSSCKVTTLEFAVSNDDHADNVAFIGKHATCLTARSDRVARSTDDIATPSSFSAHTRPSNVANQRRGSS